MIVSVFLDSSVKLIFSLHAVMQFQFLPFSCASSWQYVSSVPQLLPMSLRCSSSFCLEVNEFTDLESCPVYWELLIVLGFKAVCPEYTAGLNVLVSTSTQVGFPVVLLRLQAYMWSGLLKVESRVFLSVFCTVYVFNSVKRLRVSYGHGVQNFIQ